MAARESVRLPVITGRSTVSAVRGAARVKLRPSFKIDLRRFGNRSGAHGSSAVGFESTEVARWRLSSLAVADRTVCEALAPLDAEVPNDALDALGQDLLRSPGAAAGLLTAFGASTRALQLVWEMHARGAVALPADVVAALHQALKSVDGMWC